MPQLPHTSVEPLPIDQPARNGNRPDPKPRTPRLWQRRRALAIAGVASFAVGLPLVSVEDGVVLSSVGLFLEAIALTCLLLIVFALIDEGREGEGEEH